MTELIQAEYLLTELLKNDNKPLSFDSFKEGKSKKGTLITGKGMKSFYLGAFTKQESEFIKSLISQRNNMENPKTLRIVHTKDSNGLTSKKDIHLFSGSSFIGTFRIDINKESNATHFLTVQTVLKLMIQNNIKFDLILIDPPYNAVYDKKYGTRQLNNIKDDNKFLKWLVDECLTVLNPRGIIISKNWRSIRPENSHFIGGMISKYGGYRRATLLEAWEYQPSIDKTECFTFSLKDHEVSWNIKKSELIQWFIGEKNDWSKEERKYVLNHIDIIKNGVFITNNEKDLFNLGLKCMTIDEFLETNENFDVIILSECKGVGGSVKKTNALKEKISEVLMKDGKAILKTYFDPVLQQKGLKFIDNAVIMYENYEKINLLHTYTR